MSRSAPQNDSNSFDPLKFFREQARGAKLASGIDPDRAVSLRVCDAKLHAEANDEQHQENIRQIINYMSELSPKRVVSSSSRLEKKVSADTEEAGRAMLPPSSAITSEAMTGSNNKKIKTSLTSDNRYEKEPKVKAGVEQTKRGVDNPPSVKETERYPHKTTSSTAKNNSTSIEKYGVSCAMSTGQTERYHVPENLPGWYTSISTDSLPMKTLSKKRPPALATLQYLKTLVEQCEIAVTARRSYDLPSLYDKLRDRIHEAEATLRVTQHIIRKANMLNSHFGLPRIFHGTVDFPTDIKADSYQLYKRWYNNDLVQSLLRGINSKKSKLRNADSIDAAYRSEFPNSAKYFGHGTLVQGQWWPTQLCAVRDGAHGTPQGGICGNPEQGAYSIVLSSGTNYDDADMGDTILYSGTSGYERVPTENTKALLTSRQSSRPVRVLRSAQLPKGNQYRPDIGLRYDGLYTVVDAELRHEFKAEYRFRLERCEGQMAIRYQGKAKRPTVYELREFERLRAEGAWQ